VITVDVRGECAFDDLLVVSLAGTVTCTVHSFERVETNFKNVIGTRTDRQSRGDIPGMTNGAEKTKTKPAPLTAKEQAKVAETCLKHAARIMAIAREYERPGFDVPELMQAGYLGVVTAVRKWREDGGATFETVLNGCVRNEMRALVPSARRDLANSARRLARTISIDASDSGDEDDMNHSDRIDALLGPSNEESQENVCARREVREALNGLSVADRDLLSFFADKGMSDHDIAQKTGKTVSSVFRARRAAIGRLGAKLGAEPAPASVTPMRRPGDVQATARGAAA
jgi:RNA polymerase sigma factor (sigma-70 family)